MEKEDNMRKLNKAEKFVLRCKKENMSLLEIIDAIEKKTNCRQVYADVPKHMPKEYKDALTFAKISP
jgi:hypothetical protein